MPRFEPDPDHAPLPTPLTDADRALRLSSAVEAAQDYATESLSAATRRAYHNDWQHFVAWCASVDESALPATPLTVAAFISDEAKRRDRAISTLHRRLAAIGVAHRNHGLPSPHQDPAVQRVMQGIRNNNKERKPVQKAPLIDRDLAVLVDTLDTDTLAGTRDRALLLIGFAAALRRSELVGINVEHLSFRPEGVTLLIPFAKTDQTGKGAQVPVPALPHSPHCPVAALQSWLNRSGLTEGAVFRRLRRGPCVGMDRLSDSAVAKLIKHCAKAAGYSDNECKALSGHSLRRGFITTAARQRADMFAIAAQSRHCSIDTVRQYVDAENRFDDHPGLGMFR